MSFKSFILTPAYLFVAALLLSSGEHNVLAQSSNDVRDCQDYTGANTTSATCNEAPGIICTGGCTGFVTATNCTRSQTFNVLEAPITTEKCTVGFGKTSAFAYICINEQFSFTCYGATSGKAQCKGCHSSSNGSSPTGVSPPTNGSVTTNGTASTPSSVNNTSATAPTNKGTTTPTSPTDAGTTGSTSTNASPTNSVSIVWLNVLALFAASYSALF